MSAMQGNIPRNGRFWPNLGLAALLVLVLLIVLAGWRAVAHHAAAAAPMPAAGATPAGPLELAAADVATVSLSELSRVLPLSGSLSPLVQTTLKSKVAGEVLELTVREGQAVRRGEVLARIDTRNSKAQLDSQQAALEKARADLALAKLNRDNSQAMLKEHYISQNAYDTADSTYQADLASERVAQAQLRLAQIAWEDAVVKAPFDGIVASRLAQPGEKLNVDDSLLTLVDLSKMELEAPAPASEIPGVKVGQVARFRVGGFGDRLFEGRVERINPMTEQSSRSIMVYLAVPNPDGSLRGGMFAQGALTLDKTAPTPAMPYAAVHLEAGLPYVFALADGKLVRRAVTLGLRSEDQGMVEVRDGLKAGDLVVVANLDTLKDGQAAVLKSAVAPVADSGRGSGG
ncbi:MAG: efflux RND transporter periplasmic adaptor subunit [Nevskia sp.]|nr:efflux RND transporter periplasmic adaptor subunit [Nevskia sp.]